MSATRIAVMDHRNAMPEPFDMKTGRGFLGHRNNYTSDFDLLTGRPYVNSASFDLFSGNPWNY